MKYERLGVLRPPILIEDLCPVFGRYEHHGFGSLSLKGTVHRGLSDCGEGRKQRRHSGCSADG
jgi:hypothetical protein